MRVCSSGELGRVRLKALSLSGSSLPLSNSEMKSIGYAYLFSGFFLRRGVFILAGAIQL